jgi:hypothetical protein
MENEDVIFLSKGKNGDALVYSTDGKSTECLSTLPIAIQIEEMIRQSLSKEDLDQTAT